MMDSFRANYAKGLIRDIIYNSPWTFYSYAFDSEGLYLKDVMPIGKKGALYLPFTIDNILIRLE